MSGSKWGGGIILVICLYAILTFAAKFAWPPSLVGTFVVGVLYGLALKMKTGWYAMVFALAVLGAIISILITTGENSRFKRNPRRRAAGCRLS